METLLIITDIKVMFNSELKLKTEIGLLCESNGLPLTLRGHTLF